MLCPWSRNRYCTRQCTFLDPKNDRPPHHLFLWNSSRKSMRQASLTDTTTLDRSGEGRTWWRPPTTAQPHHHEVQVPVRQFHSHFHHGRQQRRAGGTAAEGRVAKTRCPVACASTTQRGGAPGIRCQITTSRCCCRAQWLRATGEEHEYAGPPVVDGGMTYVCNFACMYSAARAVCKIKNCHANSTVTGTLIDLAFHPHIVQLVARNERDVGAAQEAPVPVAQAEDLHHGGRGAGRMYTRTQPSSSQVPQRSNGPPAGRARMDGVAHLCAPPSPRTPRRVASRRHPVSAFPISAL